MLMNIKQKGSTLMELVIVLSIFAFLVLVTATTLINVFSGSNQGVSALSNVDQARLVSSQFTNEIRNAIVGVDGSYQLNTAGDNQIIFYSKAPFDGATINRVNYYLSSNILYKGITVPSGTPQIYNLANEYKIIVQRDVVNQGTPIFSYYDGNYDGTTNPLTQPINVNSVKFIKINLMVLNQTQAQSTSKFSISTGATIRNLKNNLGN